MEDAGSAATVFDGVVVPEEAGGSDVSDAELPHNSRTAWETGWLRPPS